MLQQSKWEKWPVKVWLLYSQKILSVSLMNKLIGKMLLSTCFGMVMGFSVTAQAADDVPDHKLSEWKIGNIIHGEEYKMEDLEGKVVVIEEWGTR